MTAVARVNMCATLVVVLLDAANNGAKLACNTSATPIRTAVLFIESGSCSLSLLRRIGRQTKVVATAKP